MTTNHIATAGEHMAYFVNAAGTAAPTGREQRMSDLMTRWREQVSKRKGMLSTVSILPLAACGGGGSLVINNPTDDISERTDLAGFRLDLKNADTELTMTLEQHNSTSFINTGGVQTVVLTTAGTTSTKSGIETYHILEGTTLTIASGTDGVNVTETGTDGTVSTIDVSGRTLTGNFIDFDATDILKVTQSANLAGAQGDGAGAGSALGFGTLDFGNTDGVTLTMTRAQHEGLATVSNYGGVQTFVITTGGDITAREGIENYVLSADGNQITVNLNETGVNITGGASADTVVVGGLAVTGTYTDLTADDTISATANANISGVNGGAATGAGILNVNNSTGTFTMSVAQHQGFATVNNTAGVQTFAITTAGAITARDDIENYLLSAAGNTITVNSNELGVNITGGAGDDTIVVGGLAVSGTYTGLTATDTISATAGANITLVNAGAATGAGILDVNDSAGTFTMTQAQHQGLATVNNTDGVQTFAITTAGDITARDGIENYLLSDAGNTTITVNSLETGVNITGGAGADTVDVGGLTVTGNYTFIETISARGGANISGVNGGAATGATTLNVSGAIGADDTFTMSAAQHEGLTTVINTTGTQTFVLTTAGTITARAEIETYQLADAGGSTFTQSTTATPVTVKSGAGNDLIITSATDAYRGAMTIDLTSGGNDTVRILNSTGTLVVGNDDTPSLNGQVANSYGGFGGHVGYNAGSIVDTNSEWESAGKPGSSTYVEIVGFTAFATDTDRDVVQLERYSGAVIEGVNRTTTDLDGVASGSILEMNTADSGFTISLDQAGNLWTVANMLRTLSNVDDGEYYIIVYDGSDINANAFLYYARATEGDGFDFADTNGATGGYDTDSVELIAVFHEVGANAFSSLNFEAVPPVL